MLKLLLAYLNISVLLMQVLNHNQYVKIKQAFKVDLKQKMFLPLFGLSSFSSMNDRDPRLLEEVALFIFLFT